MEGSPRDISLVISLSGQGGLWASVIAFADGFVIFRDALSEDGAFFAAQNMMDRTASQMYQRCVDRILHSLDAPEYHLRLAIPHTGGRAMNLTALTPVKRQVGINWSCFHEAHGDEVTRDPDHLVLADRLDEVIGEWLDWGTAITRDLVGEPLLGGSDDADGLWERMAEAENVESVEAESKALLSLRMRLVPVSADHGEGGVTVSLPALRHAIPSSVSPLFAVQLVLQNVDLTTTLLDWLPVDPPHDRARVLMSCKALQEMRDVHISVDVEGWRQRIQFESTCAKRAHFYEEDALVFVKPLWAKGNLPRQMELFAAAARATDHVPVPLLALYQSDHPVVLGSRLSLVMRACAEGKQAEAFAMAEKALDDATHGASLPPAPVFEDYKTAKQLFKDMMTRLVVFK